MNVAPVTELFVTAPAATKGPVLTLQDVGVRFGGLTALSAIDIELVADELVAIVGPNGAGKTTVLNAISGLIRPNTSGRIELLGEDVSHLAAADVAARGVGRSFQDPALIEHYTVLENVLCGAHLGLRYRMVDQVVRRRRVVAAEREARLRAMALLDFAGLADHAGIEAGSLAYGARKLVDIVRALMGNPALLLLDEPSSGLDSAERDALKHILLELRRQSDVTVFVVEHHMDLVRAVATRVVGLQAGEVLMTGTPSEVLDSDIFRQAVVGGAPVQEVED